MCIINHVCAIPHNVLFFHTWTFQRVNTFFSIIKINKTFPSLWARVKCIHIGTKNMPEKNQLYILRVTFQILTVCYCSIIEIQYLKYFAGLIYVHNVSVFSGLWDSTLILPVCSYLPNKLRINWRLVVAVRDDHPEPVIPAPNCCHGRKASQ